MLNQLEDPCMIGSDCVSTSPLSALWAEAFVELPYSPALLLDARFSVVLTDTPDFQAACAEGFEMYFFEVWEFKGVGEDGQDIFEMRSYEWAHLIQYLMAAAAPWDMWGVPAMPVVWSAGFMLGWLSAHALVDRPASLMVLEVLYALIEPSLSLVARG